MQALVDKWDIDTLVFDPPQLGSVLYLPGLPGAGSTIYDRSPYGNHGIITSATWKRLPSGLWYLYFDGTDDVVNCGNASSLEVLTGFTLIAWIKCENWTNPNDAPIFDKAWDNTTWAYSLWAASGGELRGTMNDLDQTTSNMNMALSTFYQIALAWDKALANLQFYKNGSLIETLGVGGTPLGANTADLKIGEDYNANDRFNGIIALPKIFNRPLSELEIQNLFNREKYLFGVWL